VKPILSSCEVITAALAHSLRNLFHANLQHIKLGLCLKLRRNRDKNNVNANWSFWWF